MARFDTDSHVQEAGAALADLFVEGRPKMIWRFVTFMCLQKNCHQMLEDYVNAQTNKIPNFLRKLKKDWKNILTNTSLYFPKNDEDAADKIILGRSFLANRHHSLVVEER